MPVFSDRPCRSLSRSGGHARRSMQASASSSGRPSVASPAARENVLHSSMIDRSAGSCSSTTRMPALIACGVPAGHSTVSPGATGTRLVTASIASMSWSRAQPASSAASTSRLKPRCTAASGSASSTIQASVLPCGLARCSAAKLRSGWTCTGSRCPASSSFTSRPVSLPYLATCAAPSQAAGSLATASASSVPSGNVVIPSACEPNRAVAEAIQSSGRSSCPVVPRSRSMRPSPR